MYTKTDPARNVDVEYTVVEGASQGRSPEANNLTVNEYAPEVVVVVVVGGNRVVVVVVLVLVELVVVVVEGVIVVVLVVVGFSTIVMTQRNL